MEVCLEANDQRLRQHETKEWFPAAAGPGWGIYIRERLVCGCVGLTCVCTVTCSFVHEWLYNYGSNIYKWRNKRGGGAIVTHGCLSCKRMPEFLTRHKRFFIYTFMPERRRGVTVPERIASDLENTDAGYKTRIWIEIWLWNDSLFSCFPSVV